VAKSSNKKQKTKAKKANSQNKNKANKKADNQNLETDGDTQEITLERALELAKAHHNAQNFIIADRTYRDILRAVPNHFPTTHLLGVLLYQTGNPDQAIDYLQLALETEPNDKQIWNNLGAIYTDTEKYDKALSAYEMALQIDPGFTEAINNKCLTLILLANYEDAEMLAKQTLDNDPENFDALINLGMAYSHQQKFDEAIDAWKLAAKVNPDIDRVWTNWGNTLRDMGKYKESEEKCKQALSLNPQNHEALNNLGNAIRDMGDSVEAEKYYREATNLQPDFYEAHNNLAIALCDQNKFEEAVVSARYAVAFNKNDSNCYSTLSKALREMGEYMLARSAAQRAIYLAPEKAEPYLDLADVNLMADFLDDGEACLHEALKREPDSARAYKKLADIKDKMGDFSGALGAIDKAIEMNPNMPILWLSKAQILQFAHNKEETLNAIDKALSLAPNFPYSYIVKAEILISNGQNKEAEKLVRKALELNEELPSAYNSLTSLKKFKSPQDADFKALKKLTKNEMKWGLPGACALNFALSSAYEDMKKYDLSFKHLKKANDYKRKTIPYNPSVAHLAYERTKNKLININTSQGKKAGYKSDLPVFIVGMPRSGTTLTEQIISSHPDVYGAGELGLIKSVRHMRNDLNSEDFKQMGKEYVEEVKKLDTSKKAKRITDKMPSNFMNILLIKSILPNAKIIHCRRNPIDTCLSCYKQNFANGQYWSYNLEDLAAEYNRYLDIMAYWRETIPDYFIDIDYEDTVGNFEQQARYLIEYIGLPWDDACLTPHKQKRAVLTASKAQVTKPVYKSSVEKWKRYEKHLKPLVDNVNMDLYEQSLSTRKIKY
jgi:tetratricopeptide (TPR) repeat protein